MNECRTAGELHASRRSEIGRSGRRADQRHDQGLAHAYHLSVPVLVICAVVVALAGGAALGYLLARASPAAAGRYASAAGITGSGPVGRGDRRPRHRSRRPGPGRAPSVGQSRRAAHGCPLRQPLRGARSRRVDPDRDPRGSFDPRRDQAAGRSTRPGADCRCRGGHSVARSSAADARRVGGSAARRTSPKRTGSRPCGATSSRTCPTS